MKERPILFKGEMVRAILDGRKTQTRRVVKLGDHDEVWETRRKVYRNNRDRTGMNEAWELPCPFGQFGDRLWVRECFSKSTVGDLPWYWADGNPVSGDYEKPRPSIHMPRWASRILLEVVEVRIERLQEISEEDAHAEGVDYTPFDQTIAYRNYSVKDSWIAVWGDTDEETAVKQSFKSLWTSTGGDWDANPWVWVIEFRRVV